MLTADAAALHSYVVDHPQVPPQAIADMLFRTRGPRRYRALCMVEDRDGLLSALRAVADGRDHPAVVGTGTPAATGRAAFVFPGQGSQRPGMGRLFYESVPAFRDEADRCAAVFEEQFGHSPLNYLLEEQFPVDDTATTVQPALFTQMAGLAAIWKSFGIAPSVTVGHSQGEIAAAYVAQVMTLPDAVRAIWIRAQAVDVSTGGDYAMGVVAAGRDACEDLLARSDGWAQLSVVNSPTMVGISGEVTVIEGIVEAFTQRGVFARVIRVRYPAHTVLMNKIGDTVRRDMHRHLDNRTFLDSETACIGATLGGRLTDEFTTDQYWFLNLRNTVRFDRAIEAAGKHEIGLFVELAEHPTLQVAIEQNLAALADDGAPTVIGTSVRTARNLDEFTRNLAVAAINIADFPWDRLGDESDRPAPLPLLDFPNSPMRASVSWLPYITGQNPQATRVEPVRPAEPVRQPAAGARPRLLVEHWQRLSRRSLMAPRTIGVVDHTGTFAALVSDLCSAAADIGASARPVADESGGATAGFDTLVILVPPSAATNDSAAAADVAAFFGARDWWPGLDETVTDCWLVTAGGESVLDDDAPPDLLAAAASAGFRSVGAEHPGVRFRHLDLPTGAAPSAIDILASLHTDGETELALRHGAVYAKRVVERDSPAADATHYEHVLIVGGTGNVGLEVCEHYAHRGARRITLVSRSGETDAVAERLGHIRSAASTTIQVSACDIGDGAAVQRLADENLSTPADLIVHAAVVFTGNELGDITADKVDEALRAKVVGISRVLESFPRTSACRVLLCSSIGANVGGRGLVVYAAANRMLDAMARRRRAEGLDCVAVQWGHWAVTFDPEAEHTNRLGSTGLLPMATDGALAMGLGHLPENSIVAAFDLERARSVLDICGRASLLSELSSPVTDNLVGGDDGDDGDVSQRFMNLVAGTIGVQGVESIDTTLPLVAIGLDSLQALEIRRRVKSEFNHDLEIADLLGGASISDVLVRLGAH
ncbi:nocobactin polyketide synthase NbtC [Mycobacterium deserti]|uniref:nocobactin polyketide synthase NbtC n=1 Tax=Mycobacterium deserti TaxID=2978347 RepID=UPI0028D3DBFF|nr:nocobactin polyketide synthase NbtC [Mycobacterium deserti]